MRYEETDDIAVDSDTVSIEGVEEREQSAAENTEQELICGLPAAQIVFMITAARWDMRLSTAHRARASAYLTTIDASDRAQPSDQYYLDNRLTDLGLEIVFQVLPEGALWMFPAVFADSLRRARMNGATCFDLKLEKVNIEDRDGWRVSWSGDGWQQYSRQSSDAQARARRDDLVEAAGLLGLVPVPEGGPAILFLARLSEEDALVSVDMAKTKTSDAAWDNSRMTPLDRAEAASIILERETTALLQFVKLRDKALSEMTREERLFVQEQFQKIDKSRNDALAPFTPRSFGSGDE